MRHDAAGVDCDVDRSRAVGPRAWWDGRLRPTTQDSTITPAPGRRSVRTSTPATSARGAVDGLPL